MKGTFKRVLAGLAAAAVSLGGLALGAASASAADPAVLGTTITINAPKDDQGNPNNEGLKNRTFDVYKLASYVNYDGSQSAGLETVGFANSQTPQKQQPTDAQKAEYQEIRRALGEVSTGDDAYGKGNTAKADDPLAWAAQKEGRLDQSPDSPWNGLTRQLAETLDLTKLVKTRTVETGDANGSFVIGGDQNNNNGNGPLEPGLYLVVDTTNTNGKTTNWTDSLKIIVGTQLKIQVKDADGNVTTPELSNGQINLKNQQLPVHKQVVDANNNPLNNPDYYIGQTVRYELTTEVPAYTGYEQAKDAPYDGAKARVLKLTDKLSKGLTFSKIVSVTVTPTKGVADGETNATENLAPETTAPVYNEDGTVKTAGSNDKDYRLTVENVDKYNADDDLAQQGTNNVSDAIKNGAATKVTVNLGGYANEATGAQKLFAKGGKVTVILEATLNKDAVITTPGDPQGNPNKVELEYSNNPDNIDNKNKVPGGEVNVYTYKFQLEKYAKDGEAQVKLRGAKFKIKAGDYGWLKNAVTEKSQIAWQYTDNEAEAHEFVSDGNGLVQGLDGLDATTDDGTAIKYTVKETQAPDGYQNAILPDFTFTITPQRAPDDATRPAGQNNNDQWGDDTVTDVTFSDEEGDVWNLVNKDGATKFQYNVRNVKSIMQLPQTGGAGMILVVVAAVLFIGGGSLVVSRGRRMMR